MAKIAHISFFGGGLVVPAHTPYERQLLRDYVISYSRCKAPLRVVVDQRRWVSEQPDDEHPFTCERCRRPLRDAALHVPPDPAVYCVACALR